MNKTELAELARKAGFEVSEITGSIRSPSPLCGTELKRFAKLVAAAEPVQEPVEPVAYIHRQGNHWEVSERHLDEDEKARGWTEEPIYTAPPQRKPLSCVAIYELFVRSGLGSYHQKDFAVQTEYDRCIERFARAIEQAHGIKE